MCNDKDKRELNLEEQEAVNGGVRFTEDLAERTFFADSEPIVLTPKAPSNPPAGPVDPPPGSVQPYPGGSGGGSGPILIPKER